MLEKTESSNSHYCTLTFLVFCTSLDNSRHHNKYIDIVWEGEALGKRGVTFLVKIPIARTRLGGAQAKDYT